ncbi:MAG: hypothetical protein Q9208_003278 [Pyrenodesmia sp. 3 TL-2023]
MDAEIQEKLMAGAAAAHERLMQLIKDYAVIDTIHPAVVALRTWSPADNAMFEQAMSNDYKTILGRSSKLENFEVNIFEAAFVKLMESTKSHVGAIQIYVEELLGLKAVSKPSKNRALTSAVRVRTMFLNLSRDDEQRQPSPTCNNDPFILPYTESGMQLLNNVQSRAGYAPVQLPLAVSQSGSQQPHTSNAEYMANFQSRSTFRRSRQQPYAISGKENEVPTYCKNTDSTSGVAMDDPTLAILLSKYRTAKYSLENCNATKAVLASDLRQAALQCIQRISKVNSDDARLAELYETLGNAKANKTSQTPNELLSPAENALLISLSRDLGQKHSSIRTKASDVVANHTSTVCRAVCASILSRHLAQFQQKILDVERSILNEDSSIVGAYNIVPLSSIVGAFDGWERKLDWLQQLVSSIRIEGPKDNTKGSEAQGLHTASSIIKYLRDATHTGYPDIEQISLDLVRVAETTWLKQLTSWVLYGRLPAVGAVDFFITRTSEPGNDRDLQDKYAIQSALMPPFVEPDAASSMLFIGRSLNYLQAHGSTTDEGSDSENGPLVSELQTRHLSELSLLTFPISATRFSTAVRSIRLSLSKNALQRLLPLPKLLEILRLLKDFFLLERGEFALALISTADERLAEKQNSSMDKYKLKGPDTLSHLMIKEGEVSSLLPRVWATLASYGPLDDEDGDQDLELARELIGLSLESQGQLHHRAPNGLYVPSVPGKFQDLLLPTATTLTLRVEPPLDLFLAPTEIVTYSRIHAYLLAIRRAHIHLSKLMTLSVLRRDPKPPLASNPLERSQALRRQNRRTCERLEKMRPVWATVVSAAFLLAELAAYFQGEVIRSSWKEFQGWLNPVAAASSRSQSRERTHLDGPRSNATEWTATSGSTNQAEGPLRDPERLMMAHQRFLRCLCETLLLDRTSFTDRLRAFMTDVDHLCARMSRLHTVRQSVDLEQNLPSTTEGPSTSESEESRLLNDLASARGKIEEGLAALVNLLREIDSTTASGHGLKGLNSEDNFVPKVNNRLDRLLLKLDYTSPQTRASHSSDADAFGWSE